MLFHHFIRLSHSDKANVLHRSVKCELNSVKCQTLVLLQRWSGDQLHAVETFHKYCYIIVSLRIRPSPHYAIDMIWKHNNHRPCWICVWGKLVPENHMIAMTRELSFSKGFVFITFSTHLGVFKFLRYYPQLKQREQQSNRCCAWVSKLIVQ